MKEKKEKEHKTYKCKRKGKETIERKLIRNC